MTKNNKKNKNLKQENSDNKVIHGLVGSIEEAFSEDISEMEQDDVVVADVPGRFNTEKIKKVLCFIVGLVIILFALIGFINTTTAVGSFVNDIAGRTALKNEFALYLYPVVATDPPSFEDASTLNNSTIIKIAISKILLTGDTSNYQNDTGVLYIPEYDVETTAKNIFGNSIEITHQTVGHVEDLATYMADKKAYVVASTKRMPNYYPQVTTIENVGETYTLTVDYYPPSVSMPGLADDTESSKSMTYVIEVSGDRKTIKSIALNNVTRTDT